MMLGCLGVVILSHNAIHEGGWSFFILVAFLGNIHVITVEKIRQTANFWSRFKLSLPGRIGIAKGLMLSQINYFGCIITPSKDQIREMQNIMDNFIVGIEGL